ncbi:Uncharacterised protein [Mycobacteroides abscessus subsp. abscessus]|nr:Uncharacterised protein [Mycobacteroides abscessus subsp. abscessus]
MATRRHRPTRQMVPKCSGSTVMVEPASSTSSAVMAAVNSGITLTWAAIATAAATTSTKAAPTVRRSGTLASSGSRL